MKRDQKDHVLSMYLWERGAEAMSLISDLFRYKGHHTKESRVFQSRMRFDFQSFVDSFTRYLENQSRLIGITLNIDITLEKKFFEEWLKLPNNRNESYTYKDYALAHNQNGSATQYALIELAIHALDEAEMLKKSVENIVKAREAEKGGGIYVDRAGRPFSVNDPNLDEIIKADREIQAEAEKE